MAASKPVVKEVFDLDCSICLCELTSDEEIVFICTKCQKPFHRTCAEKLIVHETYRFGNTNCPTCRNQICPPQRYLLMHKLVKNREQRVKSPRVMTAIEQRQKMEERIKQISTAEKRQHEEERHKIVGDAEKEKKELAKSCNVLLGVERDLKERIEKLKAEEAKTKQDFIEFKIVETKRILDQETQKIAWERSKCVRDMTSRYKYEADKNFMRHRKLQDELDKIKIEYQELTYEVEIMKNHLHSRSKSLEDNKLLIMAKKLILEMQEKLTDIGLPTSKYYFDDYSFKIRDAVDNYAKKILGI